MKNIITSIVVSVMIMIALFSSCKKDSYGEGVLLPPPSPKTIFNNLSWVSSVSGDMYLSLPARSSLADSNFNLDHFKVFLKTDGGTNWIILPFVYWRNISQTGSSLYYTVDDTVPDWDWWERGGPLYIYAKLNTGINFSQPATAGFTYYP